MPQLSPFAVDISPVRISYNNPMDLQRQLFRSLRFRLLAPLVITSALAAAAVAVGSYWLGGLWAETELQQRFSGIENTLAGSNFPLNRTVLDLLADLTQTQLVCRDTSGRVTNSTIELGPKTYHTYRTLTFEIHNEIQRNDQVAKVDVLFDNERIEVNRWRAALLPLAAGLSTILALGTVTLLVSSRLATRIGRLQRRVELVAGGDFDSTVSDDVDDEIGRLGGAVDSMASQLSRLREHIQRQQSERLLHQIAGGMAHQLRNSLTGARMAIELHAKRCESVDDEEIGVAIHQIEVSEDYVRRLLLVASGRQDEDRPMKLQHCFNNVRSSLAPVAKHLRIGIRWEIEETIIQQSVCDGPTWIAAASNLIHNAMQAGDKVDVTLSMVMKSHFRLTVSDNGTGIPDRIAKDVFEPFVTSKPEGMGLGLSVARRSAERLGGGVDWRRQGGCTVFELNGNTSILKVST